MSVGRLRPPFADDVQHYQKLLARHVRVEMVELRENEQVAGRLPERSFVVLLDAGGVTMDSPSLSRFIEERRMAGLDLCFVVGGPTGLKLEQCDMRLSFGADDASAPAGPRGPARAALPGAQDPCQRAVPLLTAAESAEAAQLAHCG